MLPWSRSKNPYVRAAAAFLDTVSLGGDILIEPPSSEDDGVMAIAPASHAWRLREIKGAQGWWIRVDPKARVIKITIDPGPDDAERPVIAMYGPFDEPKAPQTMAREVERIVQNIRKRTFDWKARVVPVTNAALA